MLTELGERIDVNSKHFNKELENIQIHFQLIESKQ